MQLYSRILLIILFFGSISGVYSQAGTPDENLPTDYLSASFHAGRRQALRDLMPAGSVAVIFAYPERVFSKDVDYVYHPNPDLYYFSGYKEPNAVLLIFKDPQGEGDSSYNEIFFVQRRDPSRETWNGKRLGAEGVKSSLGFKKVYNGDDFLKYAPDLKKFHLVMDELPDTTGTAVPGSLANLVKSLVANAGVKPVNPALMRDMNMLYTRANMSNISRLLFYLKSRNGSAELQGDTLIKTLISKPDSVTLAEVKSKILAQYGTNIYFNTYTNALRGIKTPEEIVLMKKTVEISSLAHAEAMRAVRPDMSEAELEGIMLYVHKKYGAEGEGYPPIVGAGKNGCILHYEENNALQVKNQLVVMDVGAEYHGYSADVTRTFPGNGKFSVEQKAIYQLVYDAQEEAFKWCRAGIRFDSLEAKTTAVLAAGMIKLGLIKDAKEVKKYYPHGMTHHLGLDVHDKGDWTVLKENMVITVEPGIYIPAGSPVDPKWWNIGVRIEDDVVIGKDGCTILSLAAPRKWEEVEKMESEKSIFDKGKF